MKIHALVTADQNGSGSWVEGTVENETFTGRISLGGGFHISSSPPTEEIGTFSLAELCRKMSAKSARWECRAGNRELLQGVNIVGTYA